MLAAVDGDAHVAWLATVDGEPAGIARYVRVAPGTVELAFEVVDEHQGRGLGTRAGRHPHHRRGRARVYGGCARRCCPSNAPSRRLLAQIGIPLVLADGLLEGEGPLRLLPQPRVDRAAVVALAAGRAAGCGRVWTSQPAGGH